MDPRLTARYLIDSDGQRAWALGTLTLVCPRRKERGRWTRQERCAHVIGAGGGAE